MLAQRNFLKAIDDNPGAVVGLSALLTTTMENMKKTVLFTERKKLRIKDPCRRSSCYQEYCNKIGADFYSPDPQGAVNYLKQLAVLTVRINRKPFPTFLLGEGVMPSRRNKKREISKYLMKTILQAEQKKLLLILGLLLIGESINPTQTEKACLDIAGE